nr:ABC transporter ATP-binding protein/permease [Geitlerinema sp. PCC 9228]
MEKLHCSSDRNFGKNSQVTGFMERFNLQVVRRFWSIAKTYWFGDEKWKARGWLLLVVLLLLAYTGLSVVLNNKRGVLISSLSAQDQSRFWETIFIFVGVLVLYAPIIAGYGYLRDRLGLEWRRWLSDRFINNYFGDRAFYRLDRFYAEVDNPDQRIAEDIKSFTQESLKILLTFVDSLLTVIAFSGVLWSISHSLVGFLVLYALAGSIAAIFIFGKPLVRLNFEQLKREANFRFSLVRIRENAESIAFYQGEEQEANHVKNRFQDAFDNYKHLLFWELSLNVVTNAYEFLPFILPALVVAPSVFAGEMEVGKVSEAQGAFMRVFFSLNVVVARLQSLTSFGAGINRLYEFSQYLEPELDSHTPEVIEGVNTQPRIQTEVASYLHLEDVTLYTPNYRQTLVENLSVELSPSQGLLVVGPSGCGKSSLLRAIAGLWDSGNGKIYRPALQDILFLPPKPYAIAGTLREQLLYPATETELDDTQLKEILQRVNLPDLDERFDGMDAEDNWEEVLSLGEQQRLSFARILINQPKYVILDEATSALDIPNEQRLYRQLQETGITFLSVGHRDTLLAYHQKVLQLSENHSWRLLSPESMQQEISAST